jgi:hypothetical protein
VNRVQQQLISLSCGTALVVSAAAVAVAPSPSARTLKAAARRRLNFIKIHPIPVVMWNILT